MKLPIVKRLDKQDLSGKGDIPAWVDTLLANINQFIEPVAKALTNRLSFQDNFLCQVKTYTLTHNVELSVAVPKTGRVIGMFPILAQKSSDASATTQNIITGFRAVPKDVGVLGVTVQFAGGAGVKSDVSIVVLLG